MTARLLAPGAAGAPALCFIHPASGVSADYAPLVARLGWPGPMLGVDAPAHDGAPAAWSIGELAGAYLRALRERGAGSPWRLLGWSVGGVIAAEMSQQLHDAGEPVATLALFDCRAPLPEMRRRPTDDLTLARMIAQTLARTRGRELGEPPADASAAAVLSALRDAGAAPAGWTEADVERTLFAGMRLARALFSHEQRRLSTPVHLFEAESEHPSHPRPPTLGWEAHADPVVRVSVPGTHFTLMAEEHAPRLAALVGQCLHAAC
jgi:thioesterase domain-containing protein